MNVDSLPVVPARSTFECGEWLLDEYFKTA
jgi:hypothetical protein